MSRPLGNPASHVRSKSAPPTYAQQPITATRASPPRAPAPGSDLPPASELFAPEQLVDLARGDAEASVRFNIGAMIDQSPEALEELEIMASFEDELEPSRRSAAYAQRVDMAIDGALATLDE